MHRSWPWLMAGLIVLIAVVAALMREPRDKEGAFAELGSDKITTPAVVARNVPLVVRFVGDLAMGGNKQPDETVTSFVVGDELKLDAEAQNAVEYRWSVNGKAVSDNNQEWSTRKDREYTIDSIGDLKFELQVRGADPRKLSQPKDVTVKTEALYVESFEPNAKEQDDHVLTGYEYSMLVYMYEPVGVDFEFYKYRYLVNDQPVRHADDEEEGDTDGEWCTESDFSYVFPAPGHYRFKVEIRRATSDKAEAVRDLGVTIVAADAVLSSFDASPEGHAALGTSVDLDCFPESLFGKSEVRFGVKKLNDADFEWLTDEEGAIWGGSTRAWTPKDAGNYLLRAEVREPGKDKEDDFRELQYTVTEGDF